MARRVARERSLSLLTVTGTGPDGAIRVGDFALVVVSGTQGVGVGTDQVWEYATHYGIPKIR